jgi:plasmid stabilization system protein ParE
MSTVPTVKYAEKAEFNLHDIVDYTLYRWGKTQTHSISIHWKSWRNRWLQTPKSVRSAMISKMGIRGTVYLFR